MAFSSASRFSILKVLLALWFHIFLSNAAPNYVYHICPNTTTYNPNSTYQVNLNSLLSSLSSNSADYLFYNATAGNNAPDKAYGLFMCRGDVTIDTCNNCVVTATREIVQRCPKEKEAYIWYDECMLRYDYRSFFSTMDVAPMFMWSSSTKGSDPVLQVVRNAMDSLITVASKFQSANGEPLKGFATGETNFKNFLILYSLVQCTPDLSGADCNRCLRFAISILPVCCTGKIGGRVLLPSCNIRYEPVQFYSNKATTAPRGNGRISTQAIIAIVVGVIVSLLLFTLCFCFLRRAAKNHYAVLEATDGNEISQPESLRYDLSTIGAATNNFSAENKVGEGGFGDVFKGKLSNGQEIAVKRLSRSSGQGAQEFKNEVAVLAKLQHRNLVRLVGFCLEREEKILIYEFVPNKSLDYFLFDPEKQQLLDWSRRYKIITGTALGILYLHEHSRLRIIHRDLKASNVLLDENMNPKISDFGMARIFGVDQSQANTTRIAGTFGYMAPEYVRHGQLSVKSDVFSFGVLILEIVSGKKSNSLYQSGGSENLLSHAWKRWRDGTPLDLVDPTLGDSFVRNEVIRCINIGLLCVQEDADERPTMTSVVHMLNSYSSVTLPLPHQPAFFVRSRTETTLMQLELDGRLMPCSRNEVSITELYPR